MKTILLLTTFAFLACNNKTSKTDSIKVTEIDKPVSEKKSSRPKRHYEGPVSNGMKGDKISFDISEDGTQLENLTFTGYWRCSGKLEQTTAGPEGTFKLVNGKASGHISEPPNGGSTAWRFELEAEIKDDVASGTFRMNINNLGCDTYVLKWTASREAEDGSKE